MLEVTEEDVLRYSQPGPRYTSYPTVPVWTKDIDGKALAEELRKGPRNPNLSLYVHIPFCEKLCHFCACNRVIDKGHTQEAEYLENISKEIDIIAGNLKKDLPVVQMHWGGGTPTFLSVPQIEQLTKHIFSRFRLEPGAEISIEVNPVITTAEHVQALRALGFQRISMGVQDFDPTVQDVINRHQTFEQTSALIQEARRLKYESINLDLVYGLPKQTLKTFESTLEEVLKLRPERLAVYSFAKVPWKQPFQRRFSDDDLPVGLEKVQLYLKAREMLTSNGYEAIGMDHFALPQDELSLAAKAKKLHRNFMGYTTRPDSDLIGFGSSAISSFGSLYTQNAKILPPYYRSLQAGELPVELGIRMSDEDFLRREVILQLMCNFELNFAEIERRFTVDPKKHFKAEFDLLKKDFEPNEMLKITEDRIQVLGRGQILVRNIAMIFDQYLDPQVEKRRFSNTI